MHQLACSSVGNNFPHRQSYRPKGQFLPKRWLPTSIQLSKMERERERDRRLFYLQFMSSSSSLVFWLMWQKWTWWMSGTPREKELHTNGKRTPHMGFVCLAWLFLLIPTPTDKNHKKRSPLGDNTCHGFDRSTPNFKLTPCKLQQHHPNGHAQFRTTIHALDRVNTCLPKKARDP